MNKSAIQKFAVEGHKLLYKQIAQRAYQYEVTEENNKADAVEARGRILSALERSQRAALIGDIKSNGYKQVIERVTYIWFNRIVALRFMEINNYLPSHIRIFSDETGAFKPEILNDVIHLEMEGLDKAQVAEYIENNNTDELYRYLLLTQCAELKSVLPEIFVFANREHDYTELLFPNNMLSGDSFIGKMISEIDEKEDWKDAVQIIGWFYQYYNDERKNEVINIYKGTVKKEDIPVATQLFTTDWVVRYMVDNSLDRYWIERHPESRLAEKLKFFVIPENGGISQVDEFVKPEDIRFFDPCMGSGHILVYAFEVFMEIYKESGYTERDAAGMIVQNNLFGLDIDERASQLAYFEIMMTAKKYDRRFFSRGIRPNVFAIKESNDMDIYGDEIVPDARMNEISHYLIQAFKDGKELGSIISVEETDYDAYIAYLDNYDSQGQITILEHSQGAIIYPMLKALAMQAKILSEKYAVVCTNPPYLNKMEGQLKSFVTSNYKDYSGDLFSVFIYRNLMFCKENGYCGYMTPFVWMFIKTYEKLREYIIKNKSITTLVQMEYSAFEEATVPICSFVLKNGVAKEKGLYFKLSDFKGGMDVQKEKVLEAIEDKECGYFYEAKQEDFTKIPGTPVAYWASEKTLESFLNPAMGALAKPRQGLATGCNDIFVRLWYEVIYDKVNFNAESVENAGISSWKWFPYNKGGDYRRWYGNDDYIVNWENDGYEIRHFSNDKGKLRSRPQNMQFYFQQCISWSLISSGRAAFRYKPQGYIFDVSGMSCFADNNLLYLLAVCNSKVVDGFLEIFSPTINFQAGDIANIPVIFDKNRMNDIEQQVRENIKLSKDDWDSAETSWNYKHSLLL